MTEQAAGTKEPFYYITVEPNPSGLGYKTAWWRRARKYQNFGVIVNDGQFPFYNVDTWFSPTPAQRNPDDARYWSLRPLKIVWPLLNKGRFRIGKEIPPGDYFIESNCQNRAGESLFFVERLQVLADKIIVDVYKGGNELVFHDEKAWAAM